jgi:hypothetical protein
MKKIDRHKGNWIPAFAGMMWGEHEKVSINNSNNIFGALYREFS